jgi:hippurate hydrolase
MSSSFRCLCELSDLSGSAGFLRDTRHQLHRQPELSFQEARTAALVARYLKASGWEVCEQIGGHGVVGTLRVGSGAKSVALRADMDALPISEQTGKAHSSKVDGVMHACGHDGHTVMLLGAAQHLAKTRNFSGTVHLIFQPAEEAGKNSGAERMIADGLFERFPCDAIFGIHNHPGAPVGTFLFGSGPFMAACDTVRITIRGRGGHAARPHQSIDPVVVSASLVMALQTIVSRSIDPTQTAVVTVGLLQAGTVSNVIPDSARMELSVRSFDAAVRDRLEERIRALAQSHAHGFGAQIDIEYDRGYPVLINSDVETQFARQVAEELVGPARVVHPFPAVTGSEDFAYYLQHKPGCFLRLGNGEASAMLHNPRYDFNDDNLTIGAAYWARLVERWLPA